MEGGHGENSDYHPRVYAVAVILLVILGVWSFESSDSKEKSEDQSHEAMISDPEFGRIVIPEHRPKFRFYEVKDGDTLERIAQKQGCRDWKEIAIINHISDSRPLVPGHPLVLPLECSGIEITRGKN